MAAAYHTRNIGLGYEHVPPGERMVVAGPEKEKFGEGRVYLELQPNARNSLTFFFAQVEEPRANRLIV